MSWEADQTWIAEWPECQGEEFGRYWVSNEVLLKNLEQANEVIKVMVKTDETEGGMWSNAEATETNARSGVR